MTPPSFHRLVDEYLNARRGLGFRLETQEGYLRDFARHAERIGHSGPVTIELAVRWALSSRSTNPAQAARRLTIVRQFARYRALRRSGHRSAAGRAPGTRLQAPLDAPHLHRGGSVPVEPLGVTLTQDQHYWVGCCIVGNLDPSGTVQPLEVLLAARRQEERELFTGRYEAMRQLVPQEDDHVRSELFLFR